MKKAITEAEVANKEAIDYLEKRSIPIGNEDFDHGVVLCLQTIQDMILKQENITDSSIVRFTRDLFLGIQEKLGEKYMNS